MPSRIAVLPAPLLPTKTARSCGNSIRSFSKQRKSVISSLASFMPVAFPALLEVQPRPPMPDQRHRGSHNTAWSSPPLALAARADLHSDAVLIAGHPHPRMPFPHAVAQSPLTFQFCLSPVSRDHPVYGGNFGGGSDRYQSAKHDHYRDCEIRRLWDI